jgi:probable F420-dependent oxidoreductase
MRRFRFGVVHNTADGLHWADHARRVESEGFSTLLVADHYAAPMACGPLIMAAASATTTLRVGSYVYNNDFRHPALLAKEVATIDVLSGGRMELGLGAGWVQSEYEAVGLRFDQPRIRADRFEESVDVIGRLLAGQTLTHQGSHYHVEQFRGAPQPAQQRIPLLIGGGAPRMIRLAARRADIAAFVPRTSSGKIDPGDLGMPALDDKVGWLETEIRDCARDDGGPERSVLLFATSSSRDDVPLRAPWPSASSAIASPFALIGDTAAMVDTLLERRERWGISYYVCFGEDIDAMIPVVRKLADTV